MKIRGLMLIPNQAPLYFCYPEINCVNNKMLESDWFLTAHIYSLILLL